MRIIHICLANFYIDNYSYQENLLPKYHKKLGHDVAILASLMTFDENGKQAFLKQPCNYLNEHGIEVTRISYRFNTKIGRIIRKYKGTYRAISDFKPDIIFVHGVQFADIIHIKKYVKKNPLVKIYIDNHSDLLNSASNWISKNIQHRIIWRYYARKINPYVRKFYGVLPVRVDFLVDMYKLPKEKIELLVMGADDESVEEARKTTVIKRLRREHGIEDEDFLIITGGKIDKNKVQILLLMDAVNRIQDNRVKLIVFGSIIDELKEGVEKRCSERVQYVGWVNYNDAYKYFAASDLAIFPGKHSVLWEQAVACGVPCVFRHWEGVHHIDLGGNCKFLFQDSINEIINIINEIKNETVYKELKKSAVEKGLKTFSYMNIAKRSIGN